MEYVFHATGVLEAPPLYVTTILNGTLNFHNYYKCSSIFFVFAGIDDDYVTVSV